MERWSIVVGAPGSLGLWLWLAAAVGAALAEAIWTAYRRSRSLPRRWNLTLLALRTLGVVGVAALVLEWGIRVEDLAPRAHTVVVLADRSASMDIEDGAKRTSRQARMERFWRDAMQAGARPETDVSFDVRGFDEVLTPYTGEAAATLRATPRGHASDLTAALAELAHPGGVGRSELSGVVVLSDGIVTSTEGGLTALLAAGNALGVPITTVFVGAPELRDVSIASVGAGDFAFVENNTTIEATIVAHGYRGKRVHVELRRNRELVARRAVVLGDDGVAMPVTFETIPERTGQFVYEIAVPPQDGEATEANNRRPFAMKVLRDKVRVLHVAGRPDWDVRALRTLLRRDPNVELLSYYILRDFDDINREDASAPLSLIRFPTDELFEEQLSSFDLLILHNFDAVPHQAAQYIDDIATYVRAGGSLVLIGGDLAFSDGAYGSPEMAALLPLDAGHGPQQTARYRPALTELGRRHPITRWLSPDGPRTLPELDTFNVLEPGRAAAKIGAATLLAHPSLRDGRGAPRALLAVAEPGKGRVVVLATGSTWRLGFAPDLALVDGARPYDLLWLRIVRWLLRDLRSGRLQLETDRPRVPYGHPVRLSMTTTTPAYVPDPSIDVAWSVQSLDEDRPRTGGTATTDALGRATIELDDLPIGSYRATARRGDDVDDPDLDAVERVFIVESPGRELANIDAREGAEVLEQLATATGGVALSALRDDRLPSPLPLGERRSERDRITARRDRAVWSSAPWLIGLLAALGAEWILRRRAPRGP